MSDWGGDWGDPTPGESPDGWNHSGLPVKNPMGAHMRAEEIQLERVEPLMDPSAGVIKRAWAGVQAHPFETLILSFVAFLLQNCGSFCNAPLDLINIFGDGLEQGSGSDYEYSGSILAVAGDFLGNIGALEIGAVLAVMGFVFVVMVIYLVIYAVIFAAQYVIWFRIHRNQDVSLSHVGDIFPFLVKMIFTYILYSTVIALPALVLGLMGALAIPIIGLDNGPVIAVLLSALALVCIVPMIYLTARLFFTTYVVLDKNLAYVEALKASWRMSEGRVIDIIVLLILVGLLNVAGFFMCLVGMIVTNAIAQGAMIGFYDRVAEPGNAYITGDDMADVFA